jgi:hypothetical protein
MKVVTLAKVKLTDEEKEILSKASYVVDEICTNICATEGNVDLEEDVSDILNDIQATISNII